MKKQIELIPVQQTGHNCKITAIATIDKYFAKKLGFEPIPLHKKKSALISIRQLSKMRGSLQGELLESHQISEILMDLGYETELIDFQTGYELFKETVISNIRQENLIIACFATDTRGYPSNEYNNNNEHAAIIHGINTETETLGIMHWGISITTTMRDFYESSMVLPLHREPEYYLSIKPQNTNKKYELISDYRRIDSSVKKSITPLANSGFRGKLLIIKQPKLQNILNTRNESRFTILRQFTKLKLKTDELIKKGNKKNKYHYLYKKVRIAAINLNTELSKAKNEFFIAKTINFEEFKQKCNAAIITAEPEFRKHRGWYQVNLILRNILGILAGITIIPGIITQVMTKHGYIGTFFTTPKTDSEEVLSSFKNQLNQLNEII